MFAAEKARRQEDLEFLAIYHSHPKSRAVPSRTDLERSYSLDVVNLILSMTTAVPDVRGWWLKGDSFEEADVEWL